MALGYCLPAEGTLNVLLFPNLILAGGAYGVTKLGCGKPRETSLQEVHPGLRRVPEANLDADQGEESPADQSGELRVEPAHFDFIYFNLFILFHRRSKGETTLLVDLSARRVGWQQELPAPSRPTWRVSARGGGRATCAAALLPDPCGDCMNSIL